MKYSLKAEINKFYEDKRKVEFLLLWNFTETTVYSLVDTVVSLEQELNKKETEIKYHSKQAEEH